MTPGTAGAEPDPGAADDRGDDRGTTASDGGDDGHGDPEADPDHDDWYRWGRRVLYAEMLLAVVVTVFSLYTAMTGSAGVLV